MRYILFVKESCPYCTMAIQLLEEKNLNYKSIAFEPDQELVLQEIKSAYDWSTVPMVFYRNGDLTKFIGGYTDLLREVGNE